MVFRPRDLPAARPDRAQRPLFPGSAYRKPKKLFDEFAVEFAEQLF